MVYDGSDIDIRKTGLQEYEKEIIRGIGIRVEYKEGQVIFSPGDDNRNIHLIECGLVKNYRMTREGRRILVGSVKKQGDLLGLAEAFCGVERTCYTGAISDVVLISVLKEDFQDLLDCDPFFLKKILCMLSASSWKDDLRLNGSLFGDAAGRN